MALEKGTVRLGGVELAAGSPIAWRFQSGVVPYQTTVTVHRSQADAIAALMGSPTQLEIRDARGEVLTVDNVWVLHRTPTDSPARVGFVVSDARWKWSRKLVVRDFNIPKKTGNVGTDFQTLPVTNRVTFDEYDFAPYSIKDDGTRWTAREAMEEVLDLLTEGSYTIAGFPFGDGAGGAGQFSLQNVTLRDPGDAALNRLLGYVPGAGVWMRPDGTAEVYDTTDVTALRNYVDSLPATTWSGEVEKWIDRRYIRPATVRVHYQREVELLTEYFDDYAGNTSGAPNPDAPFLQNVIPTVDPVTTIREYDGGTGTILEKRVPPGTWVEMAAWLEVMDADRPDGSLPWTFETIKKYWVAGDLDGVLGGRGNDLDEDGNVALRIQALKQHFRQTFRINRRYMERIRSLRAVRVGLIDPVTGARAPAAAWGQACIIPSDKGQRMARRGDVGSDQSGVMRNVDYLAPSDSGDPIIQTSPGPASVQIMDEDLGIFRLSWIVSPYGTEERFIPSNLVDDSGRKRVATRDMSLQDTDPILLDAEVESGTNGLFLAPQMRMKALLTIVPAAPNDERQLHRIPVEASEVAELFSTDLGVTDGVGPIIDVYVTPNEETARYALQDETAAQESIRRLLGLTAGGIDPEDPIPGYVLANTGAAGQNGGGDRHLSAHALAVATEVLVAFNDNLEGAMATVLPPGGLELKGNTAGITVRVSQYPSAVVDAVHQFPGQSRPMPRFALLPESTRVQVLGTLPYR